MKSLLYFTLLIMLLVSAIPLHTAWAEISPTDGELEELAIALMDDTKEVPVEEQFRIHVEAGDLSVTDGLDEDWMNILILGTDTGNVTLNYGRTDTMIIASVNVKTGKMKISSLVRDMFVQIPGLNQPNRINTANAFGGPLLAVKTVNEVLGLNITHYCSINFKGFANIIDQLGGVGLTLGAAEATIAGTIHTDAPQTLNGTQALAYVRIRSLDNNFGRNERQRKLLSSLLEKIKNSDMTTIIGAVTETFKAIATNLTTGEIVSLLPTVLKNGDQLDMLSLPAAGDFKYITTALGAAIVEFDNEATRKAFHSFVYGAN